jgi:protein tyrosine phosphatase (PTP) superfamily phosphohydrolase (DUF442 family)
VSQGIQLQVPATCHPVAGVTACGLPGPDDVRAAHAQGARMIVNLCAPHELPFDEQALAATLGMRYESIPIRGAQDLTREAALKFAALVDLPSNRPVVVHCASGNRVGAMFAMKAFYSEDATVDAALEAGRAAGLRAMEGAVREILEREAAARHH